MRIKLKEDEMPYTKEEILANHATHILDADYFAEHSEVFSDLSKEEQKKLATEMLINCPPGELIEFGRDILALRKPEGTFYSILATAHKVKSIILASLDERNRRPYDFLLTEFDLAAFQQFNSLVLQVLNGNEERMVERLFWHTPVNSHHQLMENANTAFPESTLVKELHATFTQGSPRVVSAANPATLFGSSQKQEQAKTSPSPECVM
jgi:hypothetical protein